MTNVMRISEYIRPKASDVAYDPDGTTSKQRLYPVDSKRVFYLHGKVVTVDLRSPVQSKPGSDSEVTSVEGPWCLHVISVLEGQRTTVAENLAGDLRRQLKQAQAAQRDRLTHDQLTAFQLLDFYCRQL